MCSVPCLKSGGGRRLQYSRAEGGLLGPFHFSTTLCLGAVLMLIDAKIRKSLLFPGTWTVSGVYQRDTTGLGLGH